MRQSPKYYIERNARLLANFFTLREKEITVRKAVVMVADTYSKKNKVDETISPSLVWNLVYRKDYPYGPEGWGLYRAKIAKKEEEKAKKPPEAESA